MLPMHPLITLFTYWNSGKWTNQAATWLCVIFFNRIFAVVDIIVGVVVVTAVASIVLSYLVFILSKRKRFHNLNVAHTIAERMLFWISLQHTNRDPHTHTHVSRTHTNESYDLVAVWRIVGRFNYKIGVVDVNTHVMCACDCFLGFLFVCSFQFISDWNECEQMKQKNQQFALAWQRTCTPLLYSVLGIFKPKCI